MIAPDERQGISVGGGDERVPGRALKIEADVDGEARRNGPASPSKGSEAN